MGIVCSRSSSNAQRIEDHSNKLKLKQEDNSTNSSSAVNDDGDEAAPTAQESSSPTATTTTTVSRTRAYSNYNHVSASVAEQLLEQQQQQQQQNKKQRPTVIGSVGLSNLGNTCFMNSSLQCLAATIPLTDYCLSMTSGGGRRNNNNNTMELNTTNPLGTGGRLATRYAELLQAMWLGSNTVVRPSAFKSQLEQFAPQFQGYRQHDAQEFLAYLLDGMHEDLNRAPTNPKPYIADRECDGTHDAADAIAAWQNYLRRDKSPIVDIFQGQLRSELMCSKCHHRSVRFEPFMYLSLPVTATCTTIQDCLRVYLEEEQLVGVNQWYCGKCKEHCDATKKTDLWILPPILIVHLKRFSCNDYGQLASKNKRPIEFPLDDWDLSSFVPRVVPQEAHYDLYAVSNHMGSLGGGHYTAYTKSRFDEQWFDCNDAHVRPVEPQVVSDAASAAYVLFYNRTSSSCTTSQRRLDDNNNSKRPMIRRQSENRPDLWPHQQLRDYARPPSSRRLINGDEGSSSSATA